MTELSAETRAWRARVFVATWASYAGYYFCRKPFFVAKQDIAAELGVGAADIAWVGTSYLLAYAIGQFIAGALGGRAGPRALLLVGMATTLVANAAFGLTNNLGTLSTLMFLNGIAQATGWSGNVGMMGQWFARAERGTVMGWWSTNFQAGGIAANTMAAWMLGSWGWRWSFWGGSFVMIGVLGLFALWGAEAPETVGLPPVDPEEQAVDEDPSTPDWSPDVIMNVAIIGVFYFFIKFIRYALWSWAPFLLSRFYGLESDDAGYLSTIFDVTGVAGVIAIGWMSDRFFGGLRTLPSFLFLIAMTASCGLLYAVGSTSLTLFAVAIGLIGFSLFGPDALMSGAGAIDVGNRRTCVVAAAIINGMGSTGSVVQELVLGQLLTGPEAVDQTFALLLGSSVAATAVLGVLVLRARAGRSRV
ncbi:MAG TPA: MFS transporter [Myxococcota bacterium]|nr:MFS transporter [Myxococcota bacterium]